MISGNTVQQRKKHLAELTRNHLLSKGHKAEIIENRENSEGHRDQVVVDSDIGLIHLTATESVEPNASIPTAGYADGSQTFLADKKFVVYGWNSKDKRTFLIFVEAAQVKGTPSLQPTDIPTLKNKELSTVVQV